MYATLSGYGIGWPTGAGKLLLASVGTGSRDLKVAPANLAAGNALKSLLSLMDDCAEFVELLLHGVTSQRRAC